jgi:hypothetical protein
MMHLLAEQVTPVLLPTCGSAVQSWPQPPQFLGSVARGTQLVPHNVVPAGHCIVHTLFRHVAIPPKGGEHWLLQSPQCVGSLLRSTQVLPSHIVVPLGHALAQPVGEQLGAVAGHAVVQPPQWSDELKSVSQPSWGLPVQWANPLAHTEEGITHCAAEQVTPAPAVTCGSTVQSIPQAPQFLGSFAVDTHALLHTTSPLLVHCTPQVLFWQVAMPPVGVGHALLQSPQCFASRLMSTQLVPHCVVAAGHWAVHPFGPQSGAPVVQAVPHAWQWSADSRSVSQPSSGSLVQCP